MKRQTATVDCPKSMVGRVIGKNGETIKALQSYTGALIQIDQTVEPTKVTISGTANSLNIAVNMVTDIVKGTFKGFALLRQLTAPLSLRPPPVAPPVGHPRPVYAPGYGLIPPSQLFGGEDRSPVMPLQYPQRPAMVQKVGWPTGQPMMMGMSPVGPMPVAQHPGAVMPGGMPQYAMPPAGQMYAMTTDYPQNMPGLVAGPDGLLYHDPSMSHQAHQAMMMAGPSMEELHVGSGHGRMMQGAKGRHPRAGMLERGGSSDAPSTAAAAVASATGASATTTPRQDTPDDEHGSGVPPLSPGDWVQVVEQDGQTFYVNQRSG